MRLAIHPRLVEEAVFLACRAREEAGDAAPSRWLRRALEGGYRLPPGAARDRRFERAHAVAFRRLGLAAALREVLDAHPALATAGGPVRVGPAPGRAKEGMDLHQRREADGSLVRSVVVSLLPSTLADPAVLAASLHRHAAKVADLLDPAFGWRAPEPESSPARRETVRLRYGAAWDAWTDGRLARRGLPVPSSPDRGAGDFAAAFGGSLGAEGARGAYEDLRARESLTHDMLLGIAREPASAPGGLRDGLPRDGPRFVPGAPCPFCRFPTHDWEPEPERLPEDLRTVLRGSLPSWEPADGVCGQCLLLFGSRAPAGSATS